MWSATALSLIVLLSIFHSSNTFTYLVPQDKELTYSWKALIKAGTELPQRYASQFTLEGTVRLQSRDESIFFKISNLTYQLYNGLLNHDKENHTQRVSLPSEVETLWREAFEVRYNNEGLFESIATHSQEKYFSRNIKKAIANIFQLNRTAVEREYHRAESFLTEEESIFGHGNVDYSVYPHEGKVLEVHKLHDMPDSNHVHDHLVSNLIPGPCDLKSQHNVMHDSRKKYVIEESEGHQIVKEISTLGTVVYYPYEAKSDAQYIEVEQTFQLLDIKAPEDAILLGDKFNENSLVYHFYDDLEDGTAFDYTNGRSVTNYDRLIPRVKEMLEDTAAYLEEDHIHTKEPDTERGQLINRLQRLLGKFPTEKLDEIRRTLPEQSLRIFYHLLPSVGTDASTVYIKNLIVDRILDEDTAIDLLQHISENIKPDMKTLTQIEDLLHLNETYPWNLRKVAILSFASMIHKSYVYNQNEEPYEKYVEEYVSKMKNSKLYGVQMVYILGLRNMQLSITLKYLKPAFSGEWQSNQHLRFLSMWAAAPAILKSTDDGTIIETLWPIVTNRLERTEMRIVAYFYIMHSNPSHSRLRNIYNYMQNETNEEFYRFHYQYLESVMESTEPCHQEMKLKLAQVMKFTSPATHGTSGAHFWNYRDENFGFSAGTEHYFANTNDSKVYALFINSQQFHKFQEEYMFYFKDHHDGKGNKGATHTDTISEALIEVMMRGRLVPGQFIEGAILRRDQVINAFYLNDGTMNEFAETVTRLGTNMKIKTLRINYQWYYRSVVPTDLGIPAMFEFMMPQVDQNRISMANSAYQKKYKFHVESRFDSWVHYRHGLSFYNPILDAYQGVNRFHAYDAAFPIHLDITADGLKQSLKVSLVKDESTSMNVIGLRSHVKQVVFVKDYDSGKNVSKGSSPDGIDFQEVTYGKKYRRDYTLINEDDLNTGHKWYAAVYDSELHVSNGSFKNQLNRFAQPSTKQFRSTTEHLYLALQNWQTDTLLQPNAGTYGFILKIEPSVRHKVTSIDLTVSGDRKGNTLTNHFLPEIEINGRLIYAIKSKQQILKQWDVVGTFGINNGYTISNLKVDAKRSILGENDYEVSIQGIKKWFPKKVIQNLKIIFGDGSTMIEISSEGRASSEQSEGYHKYGSCQYVIPYWHPHFHTMNCLVSHTTLRHYDYDVKYTNMTPEVEKIITKLGNHVKSYYQSYYTEHDEFKLSGNESNLKIGVTFPMETPEVDIVVTTPENSHELSGIPRSWLGIIPDSTVYSYIYYIRHERGYINHCTIEKSRYFLNKKLAGVVPTNWTLLYSDGEKFQNSLYIKGFEDDSIAVKASVRDHSLELIPQDGGYKIFLNGKEIPITEQHREEWIFYHIFVQDVGQPLAAVMLESGIHFEYDVDRLTVAAPNSYSFRTVCFNKKR